ncbi:hypothetical protein RJ641_032489 [Dillenia turbinata]|uniref:Uncharacterized protein n=1 Tax=Dillenia turbinata TaxID=194707 RepID=A0AAN8W051_9MAGN
MAGRLTNRAYALPGLATSCSWLPISTTFPSCRTAILSASRMVDNLCATKIVVRPSIRFSRASWTSFSEAVSKALVASSRRRIDGSFSIARAMATLCFCPPDSRLPRSPTWNLRISDITELFPDPLWPTIARLFPAKIVRLKSLKILISGLKGSAVGLLEFIAVSLRSIAKTDPSAWVPLTMSGVRASVSDTANAVMIKTMKDLMVSPKFDSLCLIKIEAYQSPSA